MNSIAAYYNLCWRRWDRYWFAEEPVIGLALFRIVFGIATLIYHLPRIPYIREIYTATGFMFPRQPAAWLHIITPPSAFLAYALNIILFGAIIALIVGYRTRFAALTAFSAHTYLVLVEHFVTNSIGRAISVFLFLFIFSHAGGFLSLDFLHQKGTWMSKLVPKGTALVRKLMIIQLASMYISNSMIKVHQGFENWWRGDVIRWAIMDPSWSQQWISKLVQSVDIPITIFVRIGFIGFLLLGVGILFSRTRPYAIVFGLLWHLATFIMTTISPAWLAWISVYIVLVEPKTWERYWHELRHNQIPLKKSILASLFIVVFVVGAFYGRF